jgi:hypothetical protein
VKPTGPSLLRRESSRAIKLPSRLEDDDPQLMTAKMLDKCNAILKQIKEKDLLGGSFFAEPVDPVAHGIPTYHQIITNPMDLGTVQAKMDANEVQSPEEFARLMRLIFENAIKFNVDPGHVVHQSALNLLTLFNNKFRDIDRVLDKKKPTKKELKEQKKKQQEELKRIENERKRKREEDEDPTLRMIRVMHSSCAEVEKNLAALHSLSASNFRANVTRDEFNLQSNFLQHLSTQVVQIQGLITSLIPGAGKDNVSVKQDAVPVSNDSSTQKKSSKKKKPKTEKTKPAVVEPSVSAAVSAPAPAPRKSVSEVPLTLEEQQELTDFINTIAMAEDERLEEVIDIIRESAAVKGDEEEIDLEIDLLPTSTQRKLLNFVNKVSTFLEQYVHTKDTTSFAVERSQCFYYHRINRRLRKGRSRQRKKLRHLHPLQHRDLLLNLNKTTRVMNHSSHSEQTKMILTVMMNKLLCNGTGRVKVFKSTRTL